MSAMPVRFPAPGHGVRRGHTARARLSALLLASLAGASLPAVDEDPALLALAGLQRQASPGPRTVPPGALRLIGARPSGHPSSVMDLDVGPDGRWLVTTGQDGRIVLFSRGAGAARGAEAESGGTAEVARWQGVGWFSGVHFSDADHFSVFSDLGWLYRFSAGEARLLAAERVLRPKERAYYVAVAPDGETCAWLDPTRPYPYPLVLWRRGVRRTFPGENYAFQPGPRSQADDSNVYGLEFSPDGSEIALMVGNHAAAVILSTHDGRWLAQVHTPELKHDPYFGFAWLDKGRVAVQTTTELALVEVDSSQVLARRGLTESLAGLAVDRALGGSGRVLFCDGWQRLAEWDAAAAARAGAAASTRVDEQPAERQGQALWMAGGRIVSIVHGRDLDEVDVSTGTPLAHRTLALNVSASHSDGSAVLANDADGHYVAVTGAQVAAPHPAPVPLPAPDGKPLTPWRLATAPGLVIACPEPSGTVAWYAAADGAELGRLREEGFQVYALDVGDDGLVAAVGEELALVRPPDGELRRLPLPGRRVHAVACAHHARLIATADQPQAVDEDGSYQATGAMTGTVRLWDVDTGAQLGRWELGAVACLAFSADDRFLVAGGGPSLLIHDHAAGRSIVRREFADVDRLAIGADVVVTATSDGACTVWPLSTE